MDLDTAISTAKAQGTAWATSGAPHQKHIGDAILRVVNAAQELKVMLDNPPVVVQPLPVPRDPFIERAAQAAQQQLAGKQPEKGSLEDTRKVTTPLDTAEGGLAAAEPIDTARLKPEMIEHQPRRHPKKTRG